MFQDISSKFLGMFDFVLLLSGKLFLLDLKSASMYKQTKSLSSLPFKPLFLQ